MGSARPSIISSAAWHADIPILSGIILSGGGTDGAVGVKAIKEEGGLLMVQHPDEAEYDSMPNAAIATGLADVVLPVKELAEEAGGIYPLPSAAAFRCR